jgi:hypothetical protein
VDEMELVKLALKGCTKQWDTFVIGILSRDKLPDWARLWDDFTQKDIWEESIIGGQCKSGDEENLSLVGQAKKGKGKAKQNQSGGASSQRNIDMSKVKCLGRESMQLRS